jgi:hypothetical protein
MRTFLVLICSLALASAAGGAQEQNKSKKPAPKKKQTQLTQHAAAPGGKLTRDADTSATSPNLGQYFKLAGPHAQGSQEVTTTVGKPNTFAKPTSSPHGYVGRNDGRVQQSTTAGQPTGAGGGRPTSGSPYVGKPESMVGTFIPKMGKPTTVGALATSPAPKRAVWSHNAGSLSNRPMLNPSGASQGQGKPAGGKKKGEKVSPTPRPQ